MFPGAHAQVYTNEAGEPVGWDTPSYDEPPDPDTFYDDLDYGFDDHEEGDE